MVIWDTTPCFLPPGTFCHPLFTKRLFLLYASASTSVDFLSSFLIKRIQREKKKAKCLIFHPFFFCFFLKICYVLFLCNPLKRLLRKYWIVVFFSYVLTLLSALLVFVHFLHFFSIFLKTELHASVYFITRASRHFSYLSRSFMYAPYFPSFC